MIGVDAHGKHCLGREGAITRNYLCVRHCQGCIPLRKRTAWAAVQHHSPPYHILAIHGSVTHTHDLLPCADSVDPFLCNCSAHPAAFKAQLQDRRFQAGFKAWLAATVALVVIAAAYTRLGFLGVSAWGALGP